MQKMHSYLIALSYKMFNVIGKVRLSKDLLLSSISLRVMCGLCKYARQLSAACFKLKKIDYIIKKIKQTLVPLL